MKKIEREVWVCVTAKGKVRDCAVKRGNAESEMKAGDTTVLGVLTVELKEAKPKKK